MITIKLREDQLDLIVIMAEEYDRHMGLQDSVDHQHIRAAKRIARKRMRELIAHIKAINPEAGK